MTSALCSLLSGRFALPEQSWIRVKLDDDPTQVSAYSDVKREERCRDISRPCHTMLLFVSSTSTWSTQARGLTSHRLPGISLC